MTLQNEITAGLVDEVIGLDGLRFQLASAAATDGASPCVRQNAAGAIEAAHELEDCLRALLSGCLGVDLPPAPEPDPIEACVLGEQDDNIVTVEVPDAVTNPDDMKGPGVTYSGVRKPNAHLRGDE